MSNIPFYLAYPTRPCEICNSVESKLLFRHNFAKISGGGILDGYDVVVCKACGFAFANHIPGQAAFDDYYKNMSKYENTVRGGHESDYDKIRYENILSAIKPYLPSFETHIFEIGCATGALLVLIKQNGYQNVSGLDPSPACAETARQLYGIEVSTGTLSSYVPQGKRFEFLILIGVLEHIYDLKGSLTQLWDLLPDEGRIFFSIPDAIRFLDGDDAPFQEFSLEHINFFSPISLTNLMQMHGFTLLGYEQSMLKINFRTTSSVLHAAFKKDRNHIHRIWAPDTKTELALDAYINQSRAIDKHIHETIEQIVASKQRVVVWGTGTHTLRLLATTRLLEANLHAFVDSNPRYQGKDLNGIPIISPLDLDKDSGAILISSRVYQQEIESQIRNELELDNQVITLYSIDKSGAA